MLPWPDLTIADDIFRSKSILGATAGVVENSSRHHDYYRELRKPLDHRPDYCGRFLAQIILAEQNIAVKIHKTSRFFLRRDHKWCGQLLRCHWRAVVQVFEPLGGQCRRSLGALGGRPSPPLPLPSPASSSLSSSSSPSSSPSSRTMSAWVVDVSFCFYFGLPSRA